MLLLPLVVQAVAVIAALLLLKRADAVIVGGHVLQVRRRGEDNGDLPLAEVIDLIRLEGPRRLEIRVVATNGVHFFHAAHLVDGEE